MAYKVIALDLDGTLTNSEKKITGKTRCAVQKAMDAGIFPILASGRPPEGIWPIARELGMDQKGGYLLAFNGGQMVDAKSGEIFSKTAVPLSLLPEIYDYFHLCREQYGTANYTFIGGELVSDCPEGEHVQLEAFITGMPLRRVASMRECVGIEVPKCIITGDAQLLVQLEREAAKQFSGRLTVTRSEATFLEFLPLGVDKARSLESFLSRLGMRREELAAFGDGYNDISMIRYAGLGVAMANAKDEVKAAADYVTLSNDEDGVAYAIEQLILKQ